MAARLCQRFGLNVGRFPWKSVEQYFKRFTRTAKTDPAHTSNASGKQVTIEDEPLHRSPELIPPLVPDFFFAPTICFVHLFREIRHERCRCWRKIFAEEFREEIRCDGIRFSIGHGLYRCFSPTCR